MQAALLSLVAAGSVAAAQQITGLPKLPNVVAAVDPSDPEYTACSVAGLIVESCVSALGGSQGLATADANELIDCACCVEGTAIATAYSICSDYLSEEAPSYSSEYEAYGTFYSACGAAAQCSATGAASASVTQTSASARGAASATSEESSAEETETSATATSDDSETSTITANPTEVTYAPACTDMLSIFASCTNKISDFTELPYTEQAACYCCETGFGGAVSYTDALGDYASTCSSWAVTGEPETALSVAKTFAGFCSKFTDACVAAATADSSDTTATEASAVSSTTSGGQITVTVDPATTSSSDNPAATAHIAGGAVVGAIGILAMAL